MEFSTTAGLLRDTLTTARHATPSQPSIAAYAGVSFVLKGDSLSLIGSDGDTTIDATLTVKGSKDGQILILPRPLGNFLANLDAGEEVEVKAVSPSGDLEVKASGSNPYSFRRVIATFPQMVEPKAAARSVDFSRLEAALMATRSTTTKDIPGVQLLSSADGLTLHTTDEFRLSRAVLPGAGFGDFAGVIPLGILERVARLDINKVTVDPKGRTLRFAGPNVVITARLLSTPFPDTSQVFGSAPPTEVKMSVAKLKRALSRLSSVTEQTPLKVRFDANTMILSAANADLGTGIEILELENDVPAPFEFFVRLSYLLDLCTSHDAEVIRVSYSAPLEPLFVNSSQMIDTSTVLMPIKGAS